MASALTFSLRSSASASSSARSSQQLSAGTLRPFAAACCGLLLLLARTCSAGQVFSGWKKGRATAYDGPADWWSIHEGSCGYDYLDQDKVTGWDIVALSDQFEDFGKSCGRCYEVKCDPVWLSDGYGQSFDRTSGVCYDPNESVIVQVTDSCPCWYPANAYSNKRWCCGDMQHMDLSYWAFQKLAVAKYGVVGIQYRRVSCDYQPDKRAWYRDAPAKDNGRFSRPWGWQDKRPYWSSS